MGTEVTLWAVVLRDRYRVEGTRDPADGLWPQRYLSVPEQLFTVFFPSAVSLLFKSLSKHGQSVLAKRKRGQPLL